MAAGRCARHADGRATPGRDVMTGCILIFMLAMALAILLPGSAQTATEMTARAEYDSNVNRGISQTQSDMFFGVQLLTEKQPLGESRLELVYAASLQAAAYVDFDDLSYAELSLSSGVLYRPYITVTTSLYPFIQVRGVRDSAQSAVTLGAQASITEQVSPVLQLTQYYAYRQGFARDDTYSYGMHSGGFVASLALQRNLLGDLTYEISYGDSYRGVGPIRERARGDGSGQGQGQGDGEGQGGRFSPVFGQGVIKEKVTRHAIGSGLQLDLGLSWFGTLRYVFSSMDGDSGTSRSHVGSLSVGRRF